MPRDLRTARAVGVFIGAVSALSLLAIPAAEAASPPITTQAAAANAAFLAYAPPPAGGGKALCLVDTGVNATPDTAPGLVSATALDGGAGGDADPLWHGTIDAAIAGGAGHGVLGAWPRLRVVSVRATNVPSPGQHPTFQFDDYVNGLNQCSREIAGAQVAVIALPLASVIPPTPDQSATFVSAVNQVRSKGISILAAAGNSPGRVQLPGSEPGIIAVGAGDEGNGICPFSATAGLTFYAPGCGLDQIDTRGEPYCCGNGSSQASAFAAGVLVAMRSYKPDLTATAAEGLLLSTARNGHLDASAAFRAAGLGSIVDSGAAAIPRTPLSAPAVPPPTTLRRVPRPSVKRVTWRHGVLEIVLRTIPKGARLHAKISFARRKPFYVGTPRPKLVVRVPLPRRVELTHSRGGASSATVRPRVGRLR